MDTSFIESLPSWSRLLELCRLRLAADVVQLASQCSDWSCRARQRRLLVTLDDRMLKDIGLTRADAMVEADKPFWRV
jgi:uncharacterized protein YjiS (DUF1127 family)